MSLTNQDEHMVRNRPPARVSAKDVGRFVMGTRRGRVIAIVFLIDAALLGLVLGILGASETVSIIVIVVLAAIVVPVILLQAIKATPPPQDGQQ